MSKAAEGSAGLSTWSALFGVGLILFAVPLVPERIVIAGLPMDGVILSVPIAILMCLPLLRRIGWRGLVPNGLEIPSALFLVWALVSIAGVSGGKDNLLTWFRYASYLALVPVVGAVAREPGRRRVLMWAFLLSGSITVMQGIQQYFNPTQYIGMQGLESSVATRVYATFENPNFYAEFLVLLIAASLALMFTERGLRRWFVLGLLLMQGAALMLTYTRGSWLALAIGILVAVSMIDARYIWGFIASAAVLVPIVPGGLQRVMSIFSLEGTASFRLKLWRVAGDVVREYPLFGGGLGDFYAAFKNAVLAHPEVNLGYLIYGAHNSYFTLMAETGIIGGLAFAWLVLTAARMGLYYGHRQGLERSARFENGALTAGLIAFAINAMTSNSFQHPRAAVFFWVLAGLQAGIGASVWDAPMDETVRSVTSVEGRGVFASSAIGRGLAAVEMAVRGLWRSSGMRRWLMSKPVGGGRVLADSVVVRTIVGRGKDAA